MDSRLIAFIGVAALLTIAPGPDMALVLRNALRGGRPTVVPTAAGIATGCVAWGAASSLGVAALLAASAQLYQALKLAGAAYLVFLGLLALRAAMRGGPVESSPADLARTRAGSYRQGLLTNLLNPKVGVFYVTFLPQFVPAGVSAGPYMLLLGAIHALLGLIWFACLILATRPLTVFLRRPQVIEACDRLTGGVFMLFGMGLALESRRG